MIPESESVLRASNTGTPVVFDENSPAGRAYLDAVARFLGEQREMRFVKPERRSFFRALVRQGVMGLFNLTVPGPPQQRRGRQGAAEDRPGA